MFRLRARIILTAVTARIIFSSTLAWTVFSSLLHASDWPQFLGPNRNGSSAESIATHWPKEGPIISWQKSIGSGWSSPVASGGNVVVFHRVGDREIIDCLAVASGNPVWKFDYPTAYRDDFGFDPGPRGTPAIAQGKLVTHGANGVVHCLDFATGKKLWSVDTREKFSSGKGFFGPACSPLIEGGKVILNIGGTSGAGIIALELETGQLAWKATDHEASYSSPVAATIQNQRQILVLTRDGLAGLNPQSGQVYFDFPFRSPIHASVNAATPLVNGDQVFLTASYDTGALLLRVADRAAQKVWAAPETLSAHYATPVLRDGFLFGFHGRQDQPPRAAFRCVEWKSGKIRWSADDFGAGTVILAGDQLLILRENGELIRAAATPDRFAILDRAQILGTDVRAGLALADGHLFARGKNRLVCLDVKPR